MASSREPGLASMPALQVERLGLLSCQGPGLLTGEGSKSDQLFA